MEPLRPFVGLYVECLMKKIGEIVEAVNNDKSDDKVQEVQVVSI